MRSIVGIANDIVGRHASARHQRRAAEVKARKKPSIPAMKKIVHRNKQRQK